MALTLVSSRFRVMDGDRVYGTVFPRNENEWVFVLGAGNAHNVNWFYGSTPESAVAACPLFSKSPENSGD